jgi:hypothetical protein
VEEGSERRGVLLERMATTGWSLRLATGDPLPGGGSIAGFPTAGSRRCTRAT